MRSQVYRSNRYPLSRARRFTIFTTRLQQRLPILEGPRIQFHNQAMGISTQQFGRTGHGYTVAQMHLHSLERFDFDSVLLPYNYVMMQDGTYARCFQALQRRCAEKNVALQTIKSLARRPWQGEHVHSTWYQPLDDEAAVQTAVNWVLGDPQVFLISSGDIHLLLRVLEAAGRTESRPADAQMEQMLSRS